MPKIPDVQAIPTVDVSGIAPVATVGVSQVGRGLSSIGQAFEKREKRKAAYQSSKAETDFLDTYTREINSYDERNDYDNFTNDFQKNSGEFLSKAAANIADPLERETFINRNKVKITQGTERIRDLAFGKERDVERGTVTDDLKRLENIGLNAGDDDLPDVLDNVEQRLDTAVELGYYGNEEKTKLMNGWRENVVTARIAALSPEKRLDALKQPWASNISISNQAKLKREAEEESLESEAIDMVDTFIADDLTRLDVLEKTSKIENDVLRKSVESRFDYQFNKKRQAHNENQQSLFDDHAESVMTGEVSVDNIPRDDWDSMDFKVKQNLYKLQSDAVKPKTNSDPDALIELALLRAQNDYEGIVQFLREENHRLKSSDRVKYAEIAIDGSMPVEVDDGLTDVQIITGKLAEAEVNDANAKSLILNKVGEWRRNYIKRNNKSPDDVERNKFIDQMFLETTTSPGIIWDTQKRLYDVSTEEWDNSVKSMREEDPVSLDKVLQYYNKRNYEPTRGDIVELYQRLHNAEATKQ